MNILLSQIAKYLAVGITALIPGLALADLSSGADAAGAGTHQSGDLTGFAATISSVLIYLVGAIAVIMLILGGLRYVTSQGDSAAVKSAKDTILYGVIGVVVAIMAYAIVHFVIHSIGS